MHVQNISYTDELIADTGLTCTTVHYGVAFCKYNAKMYLIRFILQIILQYWLKYAIFP